MSNFKKAVLALIVANTIWGAASPIYKWSFQSITPLTLAFWRFALPALIMLFFIKKMQWVRPRDYLSFIMLAILNSTLNIGFYFMGLFYAPSIDAPVIASSGPIFVLLASAFFLREKTTKKLLFGNLIGLTGVLFIVLQPVGHLIQSHSVMGNFLFIIATVCGSIGTILAKKLSKRYNLYTMSFWTFFIASITFLPIPIDQFTHHIPLVLNLQSLTGILFGSAGSSLLAYSLFYFGLKYIDASQTTAFSYIDPVSAIVIAIPLLHEYPTTIFIVGCVFILAGIYIAEGRLHWHPLHRLIN